ncbi:hypothetical protein CDAR_566301 [Caerostris darwini]|uniref:Uncharacterized protein n=1 Tax=Caerostris darwini TaxID=1538125 RepID=A0AAV4UDE8_9ARAC|nr:hypothetical protein CDAR_566301 [Caerostris darwini]
MIWCLLALELYKFAEFSFIPAGRIMGHLLQTPALQSGSYKITPRVGGAGTPPSLPTAYEALNIYRQEGNVYCREGSPTYIWAAVSTPWLYFWRENNIIWRNVINFSIILYGKSL